MIATITAALVMLHGVATAEGAALVRRIHNATIALVTLDSQMLGRGDRAVVLDSLYTESKALYLMAKSFSPAAGAAAFASLAGNAVPPRRLAAPGRRYSVRKALTVPIAAEITGLSESTIKRLDKDPRNTNYPGRNSTPQILAAWARLYRGGRSAAREVRAANRPALGLGRS